MKQAIIIEGPDNLGKTFLAKFLCNKIKATSDLTPQITHSGPPPGDGLVALDYQLNQLDGVMKDFNREDTFEIWDRSVIGECVYGPLYRHYDHACYEERLRSALEKIDHQLYAIVLYTDGEIYKRLKMKKKADEKVAYQTMEEAPRIAIRFVDVFTKLKLRNTLYINCANYTTFDERNEYILKRVKAWIKRKAYEHLMTENYSHTFFNRNNMVWKEGFGFLKWRYECDDYIGEFCQIGKDHAKYSGFGMAMKHPTTACGSINNVDYIFVGEAPGNGGCGKLGVPFYDDRSGNLMQVTLDRLHVHPTRYYMTNTVKCCPNGNKLIDYADNQSRRKLECVIRLKDELGGIIKKNPNVKVIALGKVAGYELARFGIMHSTVYHPAYYLRMGLSDEFYRELKLVMEAK